MIKELIELLKQFGFSEKVLLGLAVLAFIITVISAIIKLIHWAILKNNQWLLNESLKPYFSPNDVDRATRYYIPTKFQNVSPTADDEPGKTHLASAKQELMPMFLNKAFKDHGDNTKYYLILADAGMGKTTFMVNLFLNYTARPFRNLLGINANQGMKLFPLGSPDIWKDIEKIENKRETILLLDAFDEDIKAVEDYDARMKEVLEATKEFKEIVITCRTQFFPSDKEIPDDTGYTTFGGEQESYKFQRVYLSVFDDKDIKKYLKKRFSIFQRTKRKRAFEIVKKSPNLVMRPMLLSYINDLVEANRIFEHTYEIYEVLIEKWIERESKKHGIRKKYGSEAKYRELLLKFSQSLALNLYEKREERSGYFITKNDFIKDTGSFQITDVDNYGMTETEVRSKSLLNRDAEGKYKFSHKSILEYFLAKKLIQDGKLHSKFNFEGMSATVMFLDEMIKPFRNLKGNFESVDRYRARSRPLYDLTVYDLPLTENLTITKIGDFKIQNLSAFLNLNNLVIYDEQMFSILYDLTVSGLMKSMIDPLEVIQRQIVFHNFGFLHKYLKLRIDSLAFLSVKNDLGELVSITLFGTNGIDKNFKKARTNTQRLSKMSDDEFISTLQPIEDFLRDMKLLQEKLPNCKMIY